MKVVVTSSADIGNAVRRARKAAGLTQDVLSAAAGVGPRFVVELEGGKSSLQLDKVLAVLSVLKLSVTVCDDAEA
ncbi:transcriptional regulator [Sphingomonas sp. TF3]|uniref:type II toxin-antitoxin system Y4mF family antitoxin n=1 Tax=Sphingomonas sp. TF3 TaxID=2495580 RepID=UPI000F8707B1|nr:type II toxin-antitoxin system Y4mF family antitoxin [Sphingomonas sp. TF3]RUN75487.1 transcriptional regulator [Sphingomonas sp. TF3]